MKLQNLVREAFDLHVHIGPEIIPRKYDLNSLIRSQSNRLAGIAVKNHFFPTIAMRPTSSSNKLKIIYSVALNYYQGGFNSQIIEASAQLTKDPLIVWFPTINAANFLKNCGQEIPNEWYGTDKHDRKQVWRKRGLSVLSKKKLLKNEV